MAIDSTAGGGARAVCRRLCFCLAALVATGSLRAASAETDGWQLLSGYLFRDAYDAFTRQPVSADRARALGEAASLLNHPPVTAGKIERTEAQLRQLIAADGTDDTAMYARLLLARIVHLHRPAESAEVETAYRAVIQANSSHPLAQVAAGKLALVYLYQRPDLSVPQRLAAAAELAPVAGTGFLPETACAYYRALAGAALFYNVLDAQVLAWLHRADAIGTQDVLVAASLRIQLAEAARALGRREEALAAYHRFLESILPTDNRFRTARERMEELEASP